MRLLIWKCESGNITVKMNNEVSTNVNDTSSQEWCHYETSDVSKCIQSHDVDNENQV